MLTLFAVATSNIGRIARLGAVLGLVALLITVATLASILGTVLGEVAHLATLATFDSFSRARLSALIGLVSRLLAVAAGKRIVTRLVAIASTVSLFVTVDALDGGAFNFRLLLSTTASRMAQCYNGESVGLMCTGQPAKGLTTTIVAFGDSTIHGHSGLLQALKILFDRSGPLLLQVLAHTLRTEKVPDGVLLVNFALKVDQSECVRDLLVLQ